MRVLLVEDERRIASDVSRALEASGYVVETVSDGEEAWFRGDTEDYGVVILDLGLPGMDGLAVLKRWRANGRRMPVLDLDRPRKLGRAGRRDRCRRRRLPAEAVPDGGIAGAAALDRAALRRARLVGHHGRRHQARRAADEGERARRADRALGARVPARRLSASAPWPGRVAA